LVGKNLRGKPILVGKMSWKILKKIFSRIRVDMRKKLHAGSSTCIMIIRMFHYVSDHEFFLVLLSDIERINMSRIE
jgi:hypothetical protein